MKLSNQEPRYFCNFAEDDTDIWPQSRMEDIAITLQNAKSKPLLTGQYEAAVEAILRNNGFDPNYKHADEKSGWVKAGIPNGRAGAVQIIRDGYLASIPSAIKHLEDHIAKYNSFDLTPSGMGKHGNPLVTILDNFKRANLPEVSSENYLSSNAAWEEIGFADSKAFQGKIREIFKNSKVGGHIATEIGVTDEALCDDLAVRAADYAIQHASPKLAAQLGIPADIKQGLMPQPSKVSTSFLGAKDVTFPCVP